MSHEESKRWDHPPASSSTAREGSGEAHGAWEKLGLLERENLRLQRLVAELLMKNQQLRERAIVVE